MAPRPHRRGRRRGEIHLTGKLSAAVLVSGGGTNLQAFIDEIGEGRLALELAVVISNNPDAGALERARRAGIASACVQNAHYAGRAEFDEALASAVDRYQPDLLLLAGFMRILTTAFVKRYAGRILNIHPSLLPRFPGLNTHQRAIDAGERVHGSTVHFVTEELDAGPRIMQGRVPVLPDDTAESLGSRVLTVEHKIYPASAALFAAGRVAYREGEVWLDGQPLKEPLQYTLDASMHYS